MDKNINATRVIEPILTAVVQGYADPAFVGYALFPRVPVNVRGGTIIKFGKESFKLYNLKRAPGAESKRMDYGYGDGKFALTEDSLEAIVPREKLQDAAAVPGIDLATRSITAVTKVVLRSLEIEQAALATNAANYAATNKSVVAAGDKWNLPEADIVGQVEAAKEAIRAKTGLYPNTMLISAKVFAGMKNNAELLDRIKHTQKGVVTTDLLASIFDIPTIVVGKGIYSDDEGNFVDIWGTDVVIAYAPESIAGQEQPSYGYTYTLEGSPLVEVPYYDNARKSWVYGVSHEHSPVHTSMDAGFLFKGAV